MSVEVWIYVVRAAVHVADVLGEGASVEVLLVGVGMGACRCVRILAGVLLKRRGCTRVSVASYIYADVSLNVWESRNVAVNLWASAAALVAMWASQVFFMALWVSTYVPVSIQT